MLYISLEKPVHDGFLRERERERLKNEYETREVREGVNKQMKRKEKRIRHTRVDHNGVKDTTKQHPTTFYLGKSSFLFLSSSTLETQKGS